jgi:hypothetical protein
MARNGFSGYVYSYVSCDLDNEQDFIIYSFSILHFIYYLLLYLIICALNPTQPEGLQNRVVVFYQMRECKFFKLKTNVDRDQLGLLINVTDDKFGFGLQTVDASRVCKIEFGPFDDKKRTITFTKKVHSVL